MTLIPKRYGGPWQESRAFVATLLIGWAQTVHFRATMDIARALTQLGRRGGCTMRQERIQAEPPRLALRLVEAAGALGLSEDHFRTYVAPHVRWTRMGRAKIVAVSELQRWLNENAELDEALQHLARVSRRGGMP